MPKPKTREPKQLQPWDPDTWLAHLRTPSKVQAWLASAQDFITEYTLPQAIKASIDPKSTADQVKRLGELVESIPDPVTRGVYFDEVAAAWPVFKKNFKLKSEKEREAIKKKVRKRKADEWTYTLVNYKNEFLDITEQLSEAQQKSIEQYGFLEWKSAYYFGSKSHDSMTCRLFQKSNFALRILYHIKRSKNKNKRVVAIYNVQGHKEVIDIETKQMTSLQAFKEFTEGAGNFIFKGNNDDLMQIKTKLMEEEKPCVQLDTLGWQKAGFFAFANGVLMPNAPMPNAPNAFSFKEVDEFGIVELSDRNYFIPYHPGTDETSNMNEKRFSWKPGQISWADWAKLYYQVFGSSGMITMVFACATLFSDHIFYVKTNFPMLFFYGEGGSGKSKMIQFIQHWFGDPQPSLKVAEKANTDKGKIRKMAQFSNAIALFEEFINALDLSVVKTFTGFYDRYGYERADIDSKYGTETVPVQSTVAYTGNEYPTDDPFLQRLILIDHNVNEFTSEQEQRFQELNRLNRKGLTHLVQHVLQHRAYLEEHWETWYETEVENFRKYCAKIKVPSRMIENSAVIIATYSCLGKAGMQFPFSYSELVVTLQAVMESQAKKRDTGGPVQRFWDIVMHLVINKKIEHGKHLELNGNELMVRVGEIHAYYSQEHFTIHRQAALNKNTLIQKLKDSGSFIESRNSQRFKNAKSSCFVFDVSRIQGVDFTHWLPSSDNLGQNDGKQIQMPIRDFTESSSKNDDLPF